MKIAFVGLGAMGAPMASNIARKGIALTVYDIVRAQVDQVAQAGATPAPTLGTAVEGAEIVITMLPATQHVLDVVAGADSILDRMAPGGLLIDMSTIAPSGTDRVIESCKSKGIRFIDAPVGRLASHAIRGESLFMVGCDDERDFEAAKPLFDAMGTSIIRCGKAGTGIRIKIVNNFQILSIAEITAEALVLGAKLGLSVEKMKEVNGQTTATNGQMQVNFATKSLIGDTEPGFTFDLSHKDMTLAMEAAAELRLGLPVGAAARAVYGAARSTPFAKKDFSALLDYASDLAGIEPPRLGSNA
ncbi:NAD(P)-dependent oxidoreductase [Castellaniella defragrans]|uniref:NAD(P)-dependent oxidoreductase n=1 Tax=Castellaniella defragrans TaxID=75697 RepID=UPI0023F19050|nr:NAD(P)-binding domain-containing protein [Castellaniella defragrans]